MSEDKPKRVAIIAAHGKLEDAYPPFILASAAAAMDMEVAIFFTFYGLDLIHKKRMKKLKVTPVGNTNMPMPIPSIIAIIPGMTAMATWMMKKWMKRGNAPSLEELIEICLESDVRFIACQMSMDVMGLKKSEFIDGIEVAGAAAFMEFAKDADITLYI